MVKKGERRPDHVSGGGTLWLYQGGMMDGHTRMECEAKTFS